MDHKSKDKDGKEVSLLVLNLTSLQKRLNRKGGKPEKKAVGNHNFFGINKNLYRNLDIIERPFM